MESNKINERELNLDATELRLGLPGTTDDSSSVRSNKRTLSDSGVSDAGSCDQDVVHSASKAQVVGWPPIRAYRKSCYQMKKTEAEGTGLYVKVSMDGAPYLRKIDLKVYTGYPELLNSLEDMFKFRVGDYSGWEGYNRSEYIPTYEDKDGDWMLVGDVPWNMFISSCKRLRVMKGSEARGLGCVL